VDAQGRIAGEFTARTIRTGGALETTDAPDVLALGRSVVQRLKLRGVATLELTRGSDGTLYLLGVHARFGLWHTVGARAGVNIPAFVYADLVGSERPAAPKPRPSVPTAPPAPPAPPVAASRVPQSVEA
jgi:predicted ATP-grasp superfamily ATP-dependent carboligase